MKLKTKNSIKEKTVSLGTTAKENLPYAIVHYPKHYGTFLGFSKTETSPVLFCLCCKDAIKNYITLTDKHPKSEFIANLSKVPLNDIFLNDEIPKISNKNKKCLINNINFKKGLCHRCNLAIPSLRYCHEMYGGQFIQQYGWYVSQTYLKIGIHPKTFDYLPNICPDEYQKDIEKLKKAHKEYIAEELHLKNLAYGTKRKDISDDEVTYWKNVKIEESQKMVELRRLSNRLTRNFTKKIENIVRVELGFRKVGEGWVSETILFKIVKRIFPNYEIIHHHRPDWLEGLELDIYIPKLNVGIEYQGQQHFYPIKAWGGKKALEKLKDRDKHKSNLCFKKGVKLITIDYKEPLVEDYLIEVFIKNSIMDSQPVTHPAGE